MAVEAVADDLSAAGGDGGDAGESGEAYQQSKLANTLFALELHRRLLAAASPVISLLAHPGYSDTNLQSTGPVGLAARALALGNRFVAMDAEQGVLPQLYAATSPGVEGGRFYGPDGFAELRGNVTEVQPSAAARDLAVARQLWTVSEELTGVTYPLPAPVA